MTRVGCYWFNLIFLLWFLLLWSMLLVLWEHLSKHQFSFFCFNQLWIYVHFVEVQRMVLCAEFLVIQLSGMIYFFWMIMHWTSQFRANLLDVLLWNLSLVLLQFRFRFSKWLLSDCIVLFLISVSGLVEVLDTHIHIMLLLLSLFWIVISWGSYICCQPCFWCSQTGSVSLIFEL